MAEAVGAQLTLADDGAPSTTRSYLPLWGMQSWKACVLAPQTLVEWDGAEQQSAHAVWSDPRMAIPADVDRRWFVHDRGPFGCYSQKKSVLARGVEDRRRDDLRVYSSPVGGVGGFALTGARTDV